MTAVTQARAGGAKGDEAEETPKKSKKKLIIIAVVVLLLVAYIGKKEFLKPHYTAGQKVPSGVITALDQLTINLSDGHMVQVTVALQLSKVAVPKTITSDVPRFEDAITTVFGEDTYPQLLKPAGRVAAKAQILQLCQKITGMVDGAAQQVTAVYFTGLVIQ